jgi:hypothetical protein
MSVMRLQLTAFRSRKGAKTASPTATASIIDMNLLPRDRRPLEVAPAAALVVLALVACVFAMIPLAIRVHEARSSASAMEQQATDAERGVKALELNLTRQRGLRGELDDAKAQLAKLQKDQQAFQGGTRPLKDDLTSLFGFGAFLPKGVRVTAISGTDRVLKVDGVAPGPLDAIAYADKLVKAGGFSAAHMTSFAPGTGTKDGGQFSVEVSR